MAMHRPFIRPVAETDIDAILRVQAACYSPAMREARAVVSARIRSAAATSFVVLDGDGLCAYVFAYRSTRGAVTPLDAPFAVAADGDTLYIHDLAVAPRAAGRGLARRLAGHLQALARAAGWGSALVSVQDSQAFWEGLGFRVTACDAPAAMATYPRGAVYMARADAT